MDDELDDLEGTEPTEIWKSVDGLGDYEESLNQHKDVTDKVEDKLYALATIYLQHNPSSEFGLASLVGQENSNEWNVPPLSDLKQLCPNDETAKLNAGLALKKALDKHGGFMMSKRGDGVNVYRR